MDDRGIRQVIRYIFRNCSATITEQQIKELCKMKRMCNYDIYRLRILYRIAVDNHMYPTCPYCGKPITTQDDLTIDHIIPKSLGGTDNIRNLQPMHQKCNSRKGCAMPKTASCCDASTAKSKKSRHDAKPRVCDVIKCHTIEELYRKCAKADLKQQRARLASSVNTK